MELNNNFETVHLRILYYLKKIRVKFGIDPDLKMLQDQLINIQSINKTNNAINYLISIGILLENEGKFIEKSPSRIWLDHIIDKSATAMVLGFPGIHGKTFSNSIDKNKMLYIDHDAAWESLIDKAQTEINCISPFFDLGGVKLFGACLIDAMHRGVKVNIITRNFNRGSSNSKYRAFTSLCRKILSDCKYAQFKVGLFHDGTQDDSIKKHLGSVHAKILISDTKLAYIGSGEFREGSAHSNLEIGVIQSQRDVINSLNCVFNTFWQMCEIKGWRELL